MMKRMWAMMILVLGLGATLTQADVTVTNLVVAQRPGTKLVDISYDVSSTETNVVTVSLTVNNGASAVAATSLMGDIGEGITTGAGKAIVWNGGADWDGQVANLLYTLFVDDGVVQSFPGPVQKTGQTTSYRNGDDGQYEAGVEWSNPRFTDNGDGTVLDTMTGLEWIQAPHNLPGNSGSWLWDSAINYCMTLNYAGHRDWRLPSCKELMSLSDYGRYNPALPSGHPFSGVQSFPYGTSTTYAYDTNKWRLVTMYHGYMSKGSKTDSWLVWPVRLREMESPAPVPKTGQTTSYFIGDDGQMETGEEWPNPRFVDNGYGTVTDNLTGLEWIQAPHSLPGNSGIMSWNSGIDFCNGLNYAGHTNWRLPNIKELESLMHYGKGSWGDKPFEWLNSTETPFSGVAHGPYYWSATSNKSMTNDALILYTWSGIMSSCDKVENHRIWPVRIVDSISENAVIAPSDSRIYALEMISERGTPEPADGMHSNYCWQSSVTCSVEEVTADGWLFMGWSGDATTDYTGTNTVVLMDSLSKSVTANFSEDADGDWLLNSNEWAIGSNPRMSDTDGDGFDDGFEVGKGLNPTNDDSDVLGYISDRGEVFGLYSSNVVLDVAVGQVLLETEGGNASLNLQLEQSEDLQVWTNAGAAVEWVLPVDGDKKFYRVRSGK